jgi:hypothetical protein
MILFEGAQRYIVYSQYYYPTLKLFYNGYTGLRISAFPVIQWKKLSYV